MQTLPEPQSLLLFGWKPMIFLALIICVIIHRIRNNRPVYLPVFGMFPQFLLRLKTGFHETLTDVLYDYKGTFTFKGPWFTNFNYVVTSDPCNLEYILKTNFFNFLKGQSMYIAAYDFLGDSIFSTDDDGWRFLRKITHTKFHLADFNQMAMESWTKLIYSRLLPLSENFTKQSISFDLHDVLSRLSFDHGCIISFGIDAEYLTHGLPMVQFAEAFKKAGEMMTYRFYVPVVIWKLMKYFNLGWEREIKRSKDIIDEFSYKVINTRKMELSDKSNDNKSRSDLLSLFIESKDANEKCFTDNFLRDYCLTVIFAGADTIPVALSWFFWLLDQNPIVEEQIYAEVRQMVCKNTNWNDIGEGHNHAIFKPEDVKKMHYLHAALTESLRLYPPMPLNQREIHKDDQFPDGVKLKKGYRVIYSMYAMGRMESIWGKDCRDFIPERWLRNGEFVSESPYKFPAFNAGVRTCLGKDLAYYQMKVLVASIIYYYRVKVVKNRPVEPKLSLMLHMKHGLKVRLNKRDEFGDK